MNLLIVALLAYQGIGIVYENVPNFVGPGAGPSPNFLRLNNQVSVLRGQVQDESYSLCENVPICHNIYPELVVLGFGLLSSFSRHDKKMRGSLLPSGILYHILDKVRVISLKGSSVGVSSWFPKLVSIQYRPPKHSHDPYAQSAQHFHKIAEILSHLPFI